MLGNVAAYMLRNNNSFFGKYNISKIYYEQLSKKLNIQIILHLIGKINMMETVVLV